MPALLQKLLLKVQIDRVSGMRITCGFNVWKETRVSARVFAKGSRRKYTRAITLQMKNKT